MSNLIQRILLGEFDGSSSDDDDETAIAGLIMVRQYEKRQARRNERRGHVDSTSGRAWIPRDRVAVDERIHEDPTSFADSGEIPTKFSDGIQIDPSRPKSMGRDGNEDEIPAIGDVGSIDLSSREASTAVDLTGQVHQLPCCIKYDGPCSVSDYFKPKSTGVEVDGLKMEEAYFRGRKLQGTTIHFPQGYSGSVLGKKSLDKRKASDQSEESSNSWEMNAKFRSITVWNHDSLPSQDDAFVRSFHWLTVAKALHQPVTVEDLESASISQQPK